MSELEPHILVAILAAGLGVVFGIAMEWSRFCLLSGVREQVTTGTSAKLGMFAIAVAVALGQTLDGYRASNVGDREHAAVMSRSGLFVTADRKLAAVLGHQKLPRWIPQRWMLLEKQSTDGFRELVRQLSKATRQSN